MHSSREAELALGVVSMSRVNHEDFRYGLSIGYGTRG